MRIRWLVCFFVLAASASWGQQQPPGPFPNRRIGQPGEPSGPPAIPPQQMKKYNDQRYAKLKGDTDELLRLATQLKQEVDKASSNTLSLDVIKKTEEIEKLAKSVRERMKAY